MIHVEKVINKTTLS